LRIAQVTPYFLPVEGGVERHVLNLSRELVNLGHEVEVFTCNGTRNGGELESFSEVDGIPVHRFRSIANLGEFGKVWPGFATQLLRGRYDIIHAHSYRHPHTDMSLALSKFSGSRPILTSHSPFHPPSVRKPLARALVPIYDGIVAPISLRSFHKVISLTEDEATILRALGASPEQTIVIPHGVEEVHFKKVDTRPFLSKYDLRSGDIVLYLGRMNRTKGLDVLLEAFAMVARKRPESTLVLAGPCTTDQEVNFSKELARKALETGLGERVKILGRLTEEEKTAAYDACTVFVLPSVYEPYGIVLLEAAAHGKPLVSTRAGGPKSIIEDGESGYLVESGNTEKLAGAILSILQDSSKGKRMGEKARQMASMHTWSRVARHTDRAYSSTR
jgi:glycosyltransferase involved in cell wall biosynthesis